MSMRRKNLFDAFSVFYRAFKGNDNLENFGEIHCRFCGGNLARQHSLFRNKNIRKKFLKLWGNTFRSVGSPKICTFW